MSHRQIIEVMALNDAGIYVAADVVKDIDDESYRQWVVDVLTDKGYINGTPTEENIIYRTKPGI